MQHSPLYQLARLASLFWDFVDERDIDKHFMAWSVFGVSVHLMVWSAHFAITSQRPGLDIAAILGAVWAPWNIVQAAVVAWYFRARS